MDVVGLKSIILVSLFVLTYLFSLLPILLKRVTSRTNDENRRQKIDRMISFLSCFAAGVFLATCLLDIYPDVEDLFNKSLKSMLKDSPYKTYPFGASVMVVGFFLVLIIEQVVLAVKESSAPEPMVRPTARSFSNPRKPHKKVTYGTINSNDSLDAQLDASIEQEIRSRSASVSSVRSINGISDHPSYVRSNSISGPGAIDDAELSMHQDPNSHSIVRSLIMLAALSLHSVFEGLAVGLQTTIQQVLNIFGALILHKCIIAFSVGLNLVQSKLSLVKIVTSNIIFCIASPLGVGIGIIIDKYESGSSTGVTSAILQGLACGTFLYVTFFEVLPHEFNKPNDRVLKLLFVIIGFAFVNGVIFLDMNLNQDS